MDTAYQKGCWPSQKQVSGLPLTHVTRKLLQPLQKKNPFAGGGSKDVEWNTSDTEAEDRWRGAVVNTNHESR